MVLGRPTKDESRSHHPCLFQSSHIGSGALREREVVPCDRPGRVGRAGDDSLGGLSTGGRRSDGHHTSHPHGPGMSTTSKHPTATGAAPRSATRSDALAAPSSASAGMAHAAEWRSISPCEMKRSPSDRGAVTMAKASTLVATSLLAHPGLPSRCFRPDRHLEHSDALDMRPRAQRSRGCAESAYGNLPGGGFTPGR